jgi:hypothetical protein
LHVNQGRLLEPLADCSREKGATGGASDWNTFQFSISLAK